MSIGFKFPSKEWPRKSLVNGRAAHAFLAHLLYVPYPDFFYTSRQADTYTLVEKKNKHSLNNMRMILKIKN
jgi:hypothetical protein